MFDRHGREGLHPIGVIGGDATLRTSLTRNSVVGFEWVRVGSGRARQPEEVQTEQHALESESEREKALEAMVSRTARSVRLAGSKRPSPEVKTETL